MKRGISPLIATVLILGFVVSLATLIMVFGKGFIEKSTQRVDVEAEERIICLQDVSFEIVAACYLNPSRMKIVLLNTGKKNIRYFESRLYTGPDNVSSLRINQAIKLGKSAVLELTVESSEINKIEMFPVVRHKMKSLACSINTQSSGGAYSSKFDACST